MSEMSGKRYDFDNPENTGRRLRCPRCGEMLQPMDIENVTRCPYCDAKLEDSPDLEDFAIDPLIRQWEGRMRRS